MSSNARRIDGSFASSLVESVHVALAPFGLNLLGTTAIAAYDDGLPDAAALGRRFPDARTMIVVGNGGRAFWDGFRRASTAAPQRAATTDPLDAYTRAVVESALRPLVPHGSSILYPFDAPPHRIGFQRAAALAGLGRPGVLGVLLHPEFGPWMALRAAVLVPVDVAAPRPAAADFDPCPTCGPRTCVAACPATAVSDAGWDVPRCAGYRGRPDDPCATGCHARIACVIGPAHRYPDEALVFHQAAVRAALLQHG